MIVYPTVYTHSTVFHSVFFMLLNQSLWYPLLIDLYLRINYPAICMIVVQMMYYYRLDLIIICRKHSFKSCYFTFLFTFIDNDVYYVFSKSRVCFCCSDLIKIIELYLIKSKWIWKIMISKKKKSYLLHLVIPLTFITIIA